MTQWFSVAFGRRNRDIDKSARRDGTFAREDYDQASDTYTCPAGKTLATSGTLVNDGATLLYRGSTLDCGSCQFKARCCPNTPARKIPRSLHEAARDLARSLAGSVLSIAPLVARLAGERAGARSLARQFNQTVFCVVEARPGISLFREYVH
jgi:hypothetical protein